MEDPTPSITQWIAGVKAGDSFAAKQLYDAVYDRLMRLAKRKLADKVPRWIDEEDVALSAFRIFCEQVESGALQELDNREQLWKILFTITNRKAKDYLRFANRKKRGGGEVRGESIFESPSGQTPVPGLENAAQSKETPDFLASVAEECMRLLSLLDDEVLQQIAIWKMEGDTDSQVAERLGCVLRTVERKTRLIRDIWSAELAADQD